MVRVKLLFKLSKKASTKNESTGLAYARSAKSLLQTSFQSIWDPVPLDYNEISVRSVILEADRAGRNSFKVIFKSSILYC